MHASTGWYLEEPLNMQDRLNISGPSMETIRGIHCRPVGAFILQTGTLCRTDAVCRHSRSSWRRDDPQLCLCGFLCCAIVLRYRAVLRCAPLREAGGGGSAVSAGWNEELG